MEIIHSALRHTTTVAKLELRRSKLNGMETTRMETTRIARRFNSLVVMTLTLAVGLAVVLSAPASAATSVPRTSTYKDPGPDYLSNGSNYVSYPGGIYGGDWKREGTNCGVFGCHGGDFYFTEIEGATAWWYLGDFQGEYRLNVKFPEGTNDADRSATARVKWEVKEKRPGATNYTTIKTYTTNQAGKSGTRGWSDHVLLDGEVFIRATVLSGYAGVTDVELAHKDVLPAHLELAREMCLVSGASQRNVATAIALGIPVTLATAGIGVPGAIAVGVAAGTMSAVAIEYLLEQRAYLKSKSACYYRDNAILSWIHAYIAFANDIAVLAANDQAYESLGATFCLSRGPNVSKYDPVKVVDVLEC